MNDAPAPLQPSPRNQKYVSQFPVLLRFVQQQQLENGVSQATMRRSQPWLTIWTAVAVFLALFSTEGRAQKTKCPLTEAQSKKAVAAFAKIADFVTHEPRCVNCHGGVNPYLKIPGLDPQDENAPASITLHAGGVVLHKPDKNTIDAECMDCHNNMAPKRNGSPTLQWFTAAPFHSFVDKDATTLCRQFKKAAGSAEEFLGHAKDDNGGNNFAQTAFNGNRGLNAEQYLDPSGPTYVQPKPPSISHEAFMQLGKDWINAMGGKFVGDESCGCELTHDKWSGMIRYIVEEKGDEGHEKKPGSSSDWLRGSTTRITYSFVDGAGSAQFSVDEKQQIENWHAGKPEWGIKEVRSTSSVVTSGQGKFPATLNVVLFQGKYQVYQNLLRPNARTDSGGSPLIGKRHIENCDSLHGCQGADFDVFAPRLPPLAPLNGKEQDQNHVFGTLTLRTEGLGTSHKGVRIETMTVDLWRWPGGK